MQIWDIQPVRLESQTSFKTFPKIPGKKVIWKELLCMKILKARKVIAYFKLYSPVDIFAEMDVIKSRISVNSEDRQDRLL